MRYVVDDPIAIIDDFEAGISVTSSDLYQGNFSNPQPAGEVETFAFIPAENETTSRL